MRGVMSDYKADATGSDKRFNFCPPATGSACGVLAAFESPIDTLSLATMRKLQGKLWGKCNYLSLGGTSPLTLERKPPPVEHDKDYNELLRAKVHGAL